MTSFRTKIFRNGFSVAASGVTCALLLLADQASAFQLRNDRKQCLKATTVTTTYRGKTVVSGFNATFVACPGTDLRWVNQQIWTTNQIYGIDLFFSGDDFLYSGTAPNFNTYIDTTNIDGILDTVATE